MQTQKINISEKNTKITLTSYLLSHDLIDRHDIKRPTIIICPGGGYTFLSEREAEPIAMKFLAKGYNAFVLDYSINEDARYPNPLFDAARAILTIRQNADKWHVDKNKICICGFSAGGHVAASLGVYWHHDFVKKEMGIEDAELLKPNGMILGYPLADINTYTPEFFKDKPDLIGNAQSCLTALFGSVTPTKEQLNSVALYKHITNKTPKTFMWHTYGDGLVAVKNVLDFAGAMSNHDVPFEMHIFENGDHGLAAVDKTTNMGYDMGVAARCNAWIAMAIAWLDENLPLEI